MLLPDHFVTNLYFGLDLKQGLSNQSRIFSAADRFEADVRIEFMQAALHARNGATIAGKDGTGICASRPN